jgi:uncharacterized UBP type Zn finger protein
LLKLANQKLPALQTPILVQVPLGIEISDDELTRIVAERLEPLVVGIVTMVKPPAMFGLRPEGDICQQLLTVNLEGECRFDRFKSVAAPLQVEALVDAFFSDVQLDPENKWSCPHCHQTVCASRQMRLAKVPVHLIIQLKRFRMRRGTLETDNSLVLVPPSIDLTKFFRDEQPGPVKYELRAVMNHFGSLRAGHYTAHAKRGEKWLYFNDETVTERDLDFEGSSAPYMLYYTRQFS